MTRAETLLAHERERLEECPKEPIHVPGAIQPHGVLLSIDSATLECLQVSANIGVVLGREPESVLHVPLDKILGKQQAETVREVLGSPRGDRESRLSLALETPSGVLTVDALLHRSDDTVVVELEPLERADDNDALRSLLTGFHDALLGLPDAGGQELYDAAVRGLRQLTGYDRVMAYRFHDDGHGEIVAEDRREGLESFLGLHYPASDIPAQARRLYRLRPCRLIVDSGAEPAELVPKHDPRTSRPLDMSVSTLRAVPAKHLQFQRNMGVRGSLSISLVHEGELWGMLSCSHQTPRFVAYDVRRAAEEIGRAVTVRHVAHHSAAVLCKRLTLQSRRARLNTRMLVSDSLAVALATPDPSVLDLVAADGAIVKCDGEHASIGDWPDIGAAEGLAQRALGIVGAEAFVTEALPLEHPELAALVPGVAGVLVVPLTGGDGYLAWFRSEVVRTVNWLGDDANRGAGKYEPLSPRNSFELWKQTVEGRSLPWDALEVEAARDLASNVGEAVERRLQAKLAHYGLHDELTGLANRRLLTDRLEKALQRASRDRPSELLFIDLDGFKEVNDSAGHAVGDAVLKEIGARLARAIRSLDTVARYGGDEFVILCEAGLEDVHLLVDRVLAAIREPLDVAGRRFKLDASIGVTRVHPNAAPEQLLHEADAAMYRAKSKRRTGES